MEEIRTTQNALVESLAEMLRDDPKNLNWWQMVELSGPGSPGGEGGGDSGGTGGGDTGGIDPGDGGTGGGGTGGEDDGSGGGIQPGDGGTGGTGDGGLQHRDPPAITDGMGGGMPDPNSLNQLALMLQQLIRQGGSVPGMNNPQRAANQPQNAMAFVPGP